MQNGFIERFNKTLRTEILDMYLFRTLSEVRVLTEDWRIEYNEERPHSSLGDMPAQVDGENYEQHIYEWTEATN